MIWTYDMPTKQGWYWYRFGKAHAAYYVQGDIALAYESARTGVSMHLLTGQWYGPIAIPGEEAK